MRTTIDLKPEHRAQLLEIAARRKLKGLSRLVEDAIATYLRRHARRRPRRASIARLRGVLSPAEAAELRQATAALRANWR